MTVTEVDAGTATATFTATLSTASGKTVTVDYATSDLTATAPADYTAATGTLTFTPGTTAQPIAVTLQGDVLDEANETYRVTLSNPANATITTAIGTGTITDNDAAPSIAIDDVSLTRGQRRDVERELHAVTLSAPSGQTVTVRATTANGTATQPADYTSSNLILTFLPGTTTQTFAVTVAGDVLDEADDTFVVNLTTPTNATIADTQGLGTIVDDDPLPSLAINDVSRVEGNSGTANLTFTATLSAASGRVVTVNYATVDGTATAPADYTSLSGTLTFNPGVLTRTIAVPVVGDTRDEFDETFVVALSSPANATVADDQGVGTIVDNDAPPTVSVGNVSTAEGDAGTTTATFTVSLSAPSGKPISVDYATADGNGFVAMPTTPPRQERCRSPPGRPRQTVDVTVQGDVMDEFDETYQLQLSNLVNVLPGTVVGTGTITDDDAAPTVSIADVSLPEGDAGAANASLTVSLSAVSGKPIDVELRERRRHRDRSGRLHGRVRDGVVRARSGLEDRGRRRERRRHLRERRDVLGGPVRTRERGARHHARHRDDRQRRSPAAGLDRRPQRAGRETAAPPPATFTLSLTNPSAFPISVDWRRRT